MISVFNGLFRVRLELNKKNILRIEIFISSETEKSGYSVDSNIFRSRHVRNCGDALKQQQA